MERGYRYKNFLYFLFIFIFTVMIYNKAYTSQEKTQYVFMEAAESGTIQYDAKTHTSILKLKNIEPWVLYFNQKPKYSVKFMGLNDFVDFINTNHTGSFSSQGIPADLMSLSAKEDHTQQHTLMLQNPSYNARSKTMNFTVILTEPKKTPSEQIHFKNGMLFIQFCTGCAGGGV